MSNISYTKNFFYLVTLLTSCVTYPPVIEKEIPVIEHLAKQDQIKEWIRADCGSCHTSALSTANKKALQVFDLKFRYSYCFIKIDLSSAFSHLFKMVAYTFLKSTLYFKSPSFKSLKSGIGFNIPFCCPVMGWLVLG